MVLFFIFRLNKSNCLFRYALSCANLIAINIENGNTMVKKDKLSKEIEEQIQGLASDVYIQIEEKLTQLICSAVPKEATQQTTVEQDPAYIALQKNYQTSQKEFTQHSKDFTEQITHLDKNIADLLEMNIDEAVQFFNEKA